MREVAYTNHIGQGQADKGSRGTNIASASDLAAAEKHNNHDYTEEDLEHIQSNINLALKEYNKQFDRNLQEVGWVDLVQTVKEIYHEEFDQAVADYNKKQRRKDRRIQDYYEKISEDRKTDLAVEGLLQIGSKDDWEDASLEDKQKTLSIYLDCLKEMQKEFPGLRIAGASFHVNEDSPHLHWIGVCVDERPKQRGLQKVSNKSAVFTADNMGSILQDKLRERMERKMQEIWPEWKFTPKKSGRNEDLTKNELKNLQLQRENTTLENTMDALLQEVETLKKERIFVNQKSAEEIKQKELELSKLKVTVGDLQEQQKNVQQDLAAVVADYAAAEKLIERQQEEIRKWDDSLRDIEIEREYIEEAKECEDTVNYLKSLCDALMRRKSPLRDKTIEQNLIKAFKGFYEALCASLMRQRKYEVFNGIPEQECRSVPLTKAKLNLDQQVKDAGKKLALHPKTQQSIAHEINQKKGEDPKR